MAAETMVGNRFSPFSCNSNLTIPSLTTGASVGVHGAAVFLRQQFLNLRQALTAAMPTRIREEVDKVLEVVVRYSDLY